jgi:hypothetical protein
MKNPARQQSLLSEGSGWRAGFVPLLDRDVKFGLAVSA